jgi:hypothetical protein
MKMPGMRIHGKRQMRYGADKRGPANSQGTTTAFARPYE